MPALPTRFCPDVALAWRHGAALERLGPWLLRSDPLADEVMHAFAALPPGRGFALLERALATDIGDVAEAPPALRALFAAEGIARPPAWVDFARLDRGGAVVLRAGLAAGLVLGMKSLVLGYAAPGGNKPLVLSGRLREQAPRRLAETSRFVQAVSRPGGLRRHGDGFAITLKVRLMHAQVRRLIQTSGRWRTPDWGLPINQHDMLATVLLFSVALVDGLRALGYHVSPEEAEDVIHLWRYTGLLMGLDASLLPAGFDQALATAELIRDTQGPPDDDARSLVSALFAARAEVAARSRAPGAHRLAAHRRQVMHALCRHLIGGPLADQLGIPANPFAPLTAALRPALRLAARLNRLPLWRHYAALLGDRYWDAAVAGGMDGQPARYQPPRALAG